MNRKKQLNKIYNLINVLDGNGKGPVSMDEVMEIQSDLFKTIDDCAPLHLFRYRGSETKHIESFEKDEVYLSCPENFNDPTDCMAYVDPVRIIDGSGGLKFDNHIEIKDDELYAEEEVLLKYLVQNAKVHGENCCEGKTMEQINDCAEGGVIRAHRKAGIPINEIHIDELNEFTVGQMIYFFEMSAALSAYAMGLNPFDQPGVEDYKVEMQYLIEQL
ncbi:MAG: hypothetical protein ACI4LD_05840 [Lentihominibacter sp.]